MTLNPLSWFAVLGIASTGCALQATSGPSWAGHQSAASLTTGATTQAYRTSGGIAGARMGMAIDRGLVPRNGIIHAGFDWRALPGIVALEPGLDLGLGGPVAHSYSGIGAYVGASATARLFVLGVNDEEPAFNVVAPSVELVITGRGGGWAPPEGSPSTKLVGEYGGELGLRFAFGSDLLAEPQGKVQAPVGRPEEHP